MKVRIVYAVRLEGFDHAPLWLMDTCAGGTWDESLNNAKTWDTRDELLVELAACDIPDADYPPDYPLQVVELLEAAR